MAAERPDARIPPGMTTLRLWAPRHGRSHEYVRRFWRRRPGFPSPTDPVPQDAPHRRGRPELLFDEAALDNWFAAQDDLKPPERVDAGTFPLDPEERITLWRFAVIIGKNSKTVNQHRTRPGFPEPGSDGKYRAGDLLGYWNNRPGRRTRPED